MRKPNEDDLSDEAVETGAVGDGFDGVVDLTDGYGTYGDTFDDDYASDDDYSSDEDGASVDDESSDESFADEDLETSVDDTSFGADISEAEAEEMLEDVLQDDYGIEDAEGMVEDLEQSTGMSATEILEDITGIDLDGSDDGLDDTSSGSQSGFLQSGSDSGVEQVDLFGGTDTPGMDMATESDFDLTGDGQVDGRDLHEATHPLDFDISE